MGAGATDVVTVREKIPGIRSYASLEYFKSWEDRVKAKAIVGEGRKTNPTLRWLSQREITPQLFYQNSREAIKTMRTPPPVPAIHDWDPVPSGEKGASDGIPLAYDRLSERDP